VLSAVAPTRDDTLIATFADDTAVLSSDADPARASERLHHHLHLLQNWLKKWKIKLNLVKSQITFTTRRDLCPQVNIINVPIPIKMEVKYLGLHLGQKLTWKLTQKPRGASFNSN
jgi:hypothetical protein